MSTLMQDVKYGARMLAKRPGFTAVALVTLALGIGANTAIFSVVNAVLLRPLPLKDPDRLVMVVETNLSKGWDQFSVSPLNFTDWRDQNQVFEQIVASRNWAFNLTGNGDPERVRGTRVSAGLLEMVGATPAQGRLFTAEEDQPGRGNVVLISHGLWQRRFGSNPDIIGQTLTLNSQSYTVIGIMPKDYSFPGRSEIWAPMAFSQSEQASRGGHFISVFARLKDNVTIEQARTEMQSLAGRLEEQYPDTNKGWSANVISLMDQVVGDIRPALMVLLGAVAFVLLIACANVANLLLARSASRYKEIAIRTALGASRFQLVRQLLTESLLLSVLGGGLGLLLAFWGVDFLVSISPENIPRVREIGLDRQVFIFTALLSVLTGVFFGVVPAIQGSKPDLTEALKEGGRGSTGGRHRARSVLVVSEVALALVLLIGAGLMIKSFTRLQRIDPGFNPVNVMTMSVSLPSSKYREPHQQTGFYNQLIERVRSLPGVESAAASTSIPIGGSDYIYGFLIEGGTVSPQDAPSANYYSITPDYFKAMGIPLKRGRNFTDADLANTTLVAIINETFAKRYFPDEDPIGKRIHITNGPQAFREIVGIVGDVRHYSLDQESTAQMYEPYAQKPFTSMALAIRTTQDPTSLISAVRSQVLAVDRDQPVSNVKTLEQLVSESIAQPRLSMLLLTIFAVVAMVLAAVGLYGVMSYSVTQRTNEIGIRMALGARRTDVLRLVVGQGMMLAVIGVGIGLAASFVLTRFLATLLYTVSATDPLTF
ncbi:MAG TPA: ABC transporter permease, partial [Blastocatellia bacterium]|nr:ABC transporter permease [Blastocatellia bacterium]